MEGMGEEEIKPGRVRSAARTRRNAPVGVSGRDDEAAHRAVLRVRQAPIGGPPLAGISYPDLSFFSFVISVH